jgi:hypothetical protein
VAEEIALELRKARETVALETRAFSATSSMVGAIFDSSCAYNKPILKPSQQKKSLFNAISLNILRNISN